VPAVRRRHPPHRPPLQVLRVPLQPRLTSVWLVDEPSAVERFFRRRVFSRVRHAGVRARRGSALLTRAHAVAIRASGGRIRRSFMFGGIPVLVLTTTGRRSGRRRETPLGYIEHHDGWAVIASNAGSDRAPAWLLNLRASPDAEVLVRGERHLVRAREADPAEDAQLWDELARRNPGLDEYRRLTERRIPVVLLEPPA
jgi:F420H(2)-dependent quinone reductase